jgi:hypothetical protein
LLPGADRSSELPSRAAVEPLVPVGVCGDVVVSPVVLLEPIETSVSTNLSALVLIEPAALAAEPVSVPAVAADEPVPDVPVELGDESAFCRQPVTVTLCPRSD